MKIEFPKCCCLINGKDCTKNASVFFRSLPLCIDHAESCCVDGVESHTFKITGDYLNYYCEALDAELEDE